MSRHVSPKTLSSYQAAIKDIQTILSDGNAHPIKVQEFSVAHGISNTCLKVLIDMHCIKRCVIGTGQNRVEFHYKRLPGLIHLTAEAFSKGVGSNKSAQRQTAKDAKQVPKTAPAPAEDVPPVTGTEKPKAVFAHYGPDGFGMVIHDDYDAILRSAESTAKASKGACEIFIFKAIGIIRTETKLTLL